MRTPHRTRSGDGLQPSDPARAHIYGAPRSELVRLHSRHQGHAGWISDDWRPRGKGFRHEARIDPVVIEVKVAVRRQVDFATNGKD